MRMRGKNSKERKTSPPVTGLIRSNKQAAGSTRGLRDKGSLNCSIPPLTAVSVTKSPMAGWTKTPKVSKSQPAIWDIRPHLLKGEVPIYLIPPPTYVWKFWGVQRNSLNVSGISVVKMREKMLALRLWVYKEVKIWLIPSLWAHFFGI